MIRSQQLLKLFQTELWIMNKINHKNILHLHEFLESESNYYLVIDYCNKGDLENVMNKTPEKQFSEQVSINYLKQIINGF